MESGYPSFHTTLAKRTAVLPFAEACWLINSLNKDGLISCHHDVFFGCDSIKTKLFFVNYA